MHTHIPHHTKYATFMAWHLTLNHSSLKRLKHIATQWSIPNPTAARLQVLPPFTCSASWPVSQTTAPNPYHVHRTFPVVQTIRIVTMGPITPALSSKHRRIVTFVDLQSRFPIANPITPLSEFTIMISQILHTISNHRQRNPAIFLFSIPEST